MATLRTPLNFMDCILNKKDQTKMYMVLKENMHKVWVIDMEGKEDPFELPKQMINMVYMKVDPKTVKVLFSERVEQNAEGTSEGATPSDYDDSTVTATE